MRLLTYRQAAETLNLPVRTVRKLCDTAQLKRIKKNQRVVRVTMASIERLIAQIERDSNYKIRIA